MVIHGSLSCKGTRTDPEASNYIYGNCLKFDVINRCDCVHRSFSLFRESVAGAECWFS